MKMIRAVLVLFLLFGLSAICPAQRSQLAADFSATSMSGEKVELAALRGKVVLLTFWSSRCVICQNEIPKLNRLAASHTRDVVFLAATTENENIVTSYLRHQPFNFQVLPDSFGLMLKYSPRDSEGNANIAYPDYYLIDRAGRIQYHDYGWDKTGPIDDAINRALSNR
jgi:peroxiredoxin